MYLPCKINKNIFQVHLVPIKSIVVIVQRNVNGYGFRYKEDVKLELSSLTTSRIGKFILEGSNRCFQSVLKIDKIA